MPVQCQALEARDSARAMARALQREVAVAETAKAAADDRAASAERRAHAAEQKCSEAFAAAQQAITAADHRQALVESRLLDAAGRLAREQMRVRHQLLHNQAGKLAAHTDAQGYFMSLAKEHLRCIKEDKAYAALFEYPPEMVQAGLELQSVFCKAHDVLVLMPGRPVFCMVYVAYCQKCGALLQAGPGDPHGRGNDWSVERVTCKGTTITDHCMTGACSGRFEVPPR